VLFASTGRPEQAEGVYLELIEAAASAGPRATPLGLMALVNLIEVLTAQGRVEEAVQLAASVESRPAPDVSIWHQVRWLRGQLLLSIDPVAAGVVLRGAFADARDRTGPSREFALGALRDLADSHSRQGHWDDARAALHELDAMVAAAGPDDAWHESVRADLEQLAERQGCLPDP
jgi:hypothetical protein